MPRIFDNILQLLTALWAIIRMILPKRLQSSQLLDKSIDKTISSRLKSNWLQWPVERSGHGFRVFVVEPREYSPETHALLFNAALDNLTVPPKPDDVEDSIYPPRTAPFQLDDLKDGREPFDLITFPEAFLPKDDLLERLKYIRTSGCIHVGLRPSVNSDCPLFRTEEVQQLISGIKENVLNLVEEDLEPITKWINESQNQNQNFNIACLFTVDSNDNVRVCLHPKIVSSSIESTPLHDTNMKEADLYSLVTLRPTDNSLPSITIQPLICADALFIGTDRPNHQPLQAISSFANNFKNSPPDQIDIVSVTTCTRQQKHSGVGRKWHQEFRDSFIHATKLLMRHHSAVFILSNYKNISKYALGGLSGVFMPIPLCDGAYPGDVTVSVYGRPKADLDADNIWSFMTAAELKQKISELSSLGYIATIDPEKKFEAAYMLGFTINHLPRHNASWPSPKKNGLRAFTLRVANNSSGTVVFEKRY